MTRYNLLDEPWIPIVRKSGRADWIRPHEMSEPNDPPVRIESGRPDFNGSLAQFLIGLVQTCCAPKTNAAWRAWLQEPPRPSELSDTFSRHRDAFFLDGEGPRFFQDLTLTTADTGPTSVAALLLEDANADLFAKDGVVTALGHRAVAMALLTLQTNAPSGGAGHRTSLRGGGPLSTLIVGRSLWETVWLNVLREDEFLAGPGNSAKTRAEDIFPWMGATRRSGKGDPETTPDDLHPAQHFWAMPRRIRLDFENDRTDECSLLTGDRAVVSSYRTLKHGVNYQGAFKHPLTPHTVVKATDPPNPRKGRASGIPYRDWAALVLGNEQSQPARVVSAFAIDRRFAQVDQPRLWVFGYDMENMKARCWYETTTPIYLIEPDQLDEFAEVVARLIAASEQVRGTLSSQIKSALFRRPQDRKKTDSRAELVAAGQSFWARTEPAFFASVAAMRNAIADGEPCEALVERWLLELSQRAQEVFDLHSQSRADLTGIDVKRIARAWSALRAFTHPHNARLRKVARLAPVPRRRKA